MMEFFSYPKVLLLIAGFCAFCSFVSSLYIIWRYCRPARAQRPGKDRCYLQPPGVDGNKTECSASDAVLDESDMKNLLEAFFAVKKADVPGPEMTAGSKP